MSKRKKQIIVIVILLVIASLFMITTNAYSLKDNMFIEEYLVADNPMEQCMLWFKHWFCSFLMNLVDLIYSWFVEIMNWDPLQLEKVKEISQNINKITKYLLSVTLLVVALMYIFHPQKQIQIIKNFAATMAIITLFSAGADWMITFKNVGITEVKEVVGLSDYKIGTALLANNTVDVEKSLESGYVVYLTPQEADEYVYDLRLDRDVLDEFYVGTNPVNGEPIFEELSSGILGFGERHYYRYNTDWFNLVLISGPVFFIYLMGLYKMGYMLGEWVQEHMLGEIFLIKGIADMKHLGMIFKSMALTALGMCTTYFSMTFYSFYCSEVMKQDLEVFTKCFILLASGMALVIGGGFLNEAMGVDDGSKQAFRSMMLFSRMKFKMPRFKMRHNEHEPIPPKGNAHKSPSVPKRMDGGSNSLNYDNDGNFQNAPLGRENILNSDHGDIKSDFHSDVLSKASGNNHGTPDKSDISPIDKINDKMGEGSDIYDKDGSRIPTIKNSHGAPKDTERSESLKKIHEGKADRYKQLLNSNDNPHLYFFPGFEKMGEWEKKHPNYDVFDYGGEMDLRRDMTDKSNWKSEKEYNHFMNTHIDNDGRWKGGLLIDDFRNDPNIHIDFTRKSGRYDDILKGTKKR